MDLTTKFYAAKNKDRLILEKSSSGAVFNALAKYVLNKNGFVIGAAFSTDQSKVEYSICSSVEELEKYRGSKYSQASLNDTLIDLKRIIQSTGNKVPILITGTPCHVEGIRRYLEILKVDVNNIYFCSLICHGVSSPKIWKDFVSYKFKDNNPQAVYFKDKRNGWEKPTALAIAQGKEIDIKEYLHLFNNDMGLRPSCYECKFATTKRNCDISIGDFWGVKNNYPQFYDEKGVSLVIVHTPKGQAIIDSIDDLEMLSVPREHALQHNLVSPTMRPSKRDKFWYSYFRQSFEKTIQQNERRFLGIRLKLKVNGILRSLKK